MKLRRMRLAGHIERMGEGEEVEEKKKNAYRNLVRKSEGDH
jgi:hypothetical protein